MNAHSSNNKEILTDPNVRLIIFILPQMYVYHHVLEIIEGLSERCVGFFYVLVLGKVKLLLSNLAKMGVVII